MEFKVTVTPVLQASTSIGLSTRYNIPLRPTVLVPYNTGTCSTSSTCNSFRKKSICHIVNRQVETSPLAATQNCCFLEHKFSQQKQLNRWLFCCLPFLVLVRLDNSVSILTLTTSILSFPEVDNTQLHYYSSVGNINRIQCSVTAARFTEGGKTAWKWILNVSDRICK
jgi:hypothetical protein